jgi:hypothetical protein
MTMISPLLQLMNSNKPSGLSFFRGIIDVPESFPFIHPGTFVESGAGTEKLCETCGVSQQGTKFYGHVTLNRGFCPAASMGYPRRLY